MQLSITFSTMGLRFGFSTSGTKMCDNKKGILQNDVCARFFGRFAMEPFQALSFLTLIEQFVCVCVSCL